MDKGGNKVAERDYFPAYFSYLEKLEDLEDDQVGRVFRASLTYAKDGIITDLDPLEKAIFKFIKYDIDRAKENYAKVCATLQENGRKGGRPPKQKESEKPEGYSENQMVFQETKDNQSKPNKTKKTYNDNDNDNKNENDDIEKESEEKEPKPKRTRATPFRPPSADEVRAYCVANGYNIDADYFVDYYEQNGWMIGRNKMKSWEATVRNWARRERDNGYGRGQAQQKSKRDPMLEYLDRVIAGEDTTNEQAGDSGNTTSIASFLSGVLQ